MLLSLVLVALGLVAMVGACTLSPILAVFLAGAVLAFLGLFRETGDRDGANR